VILAVPALNLLVVNYSRHWAFGALRIIGLCWVAASLVRGREGPLAAQAAHTEAAHAMPYFRLLTTPTFLGCCAATFGAYWPLSLALTWFTQFVIKGLGFSQQDAGWISVLPWVFGAFVVLAAGWLSEALMARGVATRYSRSVLGAAPLVDGLILSLVPMLDNAWTRMGVLVLGSAGQSTSSVQR
jgi:hypothetical protein